MPVVDECQRYKLNRALYGGYQKDRRWLCRRNGLCVSGNTGFNSIATVQVEQA